MVEKGKKTIGKLIKVLPRKQLLTFISNRALYEHIERVLQIVNTAALKGEKELYKNVVDPFSAVFDAMRQEITLEHWLEQERARQIQKTMQNALGEFHEYVLGSMPGWEKLPVGHLIDVRNKKLKIIAEVKNKYNTTKGSDLKTIYDNLKSKLGKSYVGFTGYYVEVVPRNKIPYNKPFTPPDNVTKQKRPKNNNIRVIDGRSFYALAAGEKDALRRLYRAFPKVIGDILGRSPERILRDRFFQEIFDKAY